MHRFRQCIHAGTTQIYASCSPRDCFNMEKLLLCCTIPGILKGGRHLKQVQIFNEQEVQKGSNGHDPVSTVEVQITFEGVPFNCWWKWKHREDRAEDVTRRQGLIPLQVHQEVLRTMQNDSLGVLVPMQFLYQHYLWKIDGLDNFMKPLAQRVPTLSSRRQRST